MESHPSQDTISSVYAADLSVAVMQRQTGDLSPASCLLGFSLSIDPAR